ncbi:MAG: hypothetical protein IJ589_06290 [Lachnospiraceae bacterium]|nr:hypothetical protein [Lachnospiraceae bacterium]
MQYCPKCKIRVRGKKDCCPMCQGKVNELPRSEGKEAVFDGAFPPVKHGRYSSVSIMKIALFLFFLLEIGFGIGHYMTGFQHSWISMVMLGVFVGLIDLQVVIYLHSNLLKLLSVELIVSMVVNYYIDLKTGFHGWSVMWAIPASVVAMVFITYIVSLAAGLMVEEYSMYLLLTLFVSLFQFIPIAKKQNPLELPAVISVGIALAVNLGVLIFKFKDLKTAIERRFNL